MKAGNPSQERAEELSEILRPLGPVSTGRFFGGAGLRLFGVQFGFVMKGALYLHRGCAADERSLPPFRYQAGAREVTVSRYLAVPEEVQDETESLIDWARRAHRAAAAEQ